MIVFSPSVMNDKNKMKQFIVTLLLTCLASGLGQSVSAAEIGKKIPDCQLIALNAATHHNLQQYKGKVVYLDFWASWCPPCAKSFPFLSKLNQELKDKGLEVVVVNLDENLEEAKEFLTQYPNNFTVVADATKQCAKNFNVEVMPSSFLIDREGLLRHTHLGFKNEDIPELSGLIEKLLLETSPAN